MTKIPITDVKMGLIPDFHVILLCQIFFTPIVDIKNNFLRNISRNSQLNGWRQTCFNNRNKGH